MAVVVGFGQFWAELGSTYGVTPPAYISSIQASAKGFQDLGQQIEDSYLKTNPTQSPYASLGVVFNLLKFVLFDLSKIVLQDAPNAISQMLMTLASVLHVPTALVGIGVLVIVLAVIWEVLGK